jgi:bromodomain-containing factor 1
VKSTDWQRLNLPDYPKIVKRPMDLGTMKQKLDTAQYPNAESFHRDFKLVVANCYAYNPPGTDVHRMGQQLDALFEAKWLDKPDPYSDYGSGSGMLRLDDSLGSRLTFATGAESDEQISMMERQLEIMRQNLIQLKEAKHRRKAEKRQQQRAEKEAQREVARQEAAAARAAAAAAAAAARPPPQPRPVNGSSSSKPAQTKAPRRSSTSNAPKGRKSGRQSSEDEFVAFQEVTYKMKQELAEGIGNFEGEQLQKAIDIIRRSRPDLLGVSIRSLSEEFV